MSVLEFITRGPRSWNLSTANFCNPCIYKNVFPLVEILTCKGSWPADEGGGGGETTMDVEQAAYLIGILDHALVSRVDQVLTCF